MTSSLDLNLLLVARQAGVEKLELPDLYAVTPPRHTARGREPDSLVIYFSMTGNSPLSPEAQSQLLVQLVQKFYKTTGSLTAALRTIAEGLNLFLLDRNLRSTSMGRQGIGQLVLVASRQDTLYMAQSGAVKAFLVTPTGTQPLYDNQTSGRGLGLSRSMPVRFVQIKMAPDDYLVLSTVPDPAWSETILKHPRQQGIDYLRHQLLQNAGQELNAVIFQAQDGSGKLRILKRKADAPDMVYSTLSQPAEEEIPEAQPAMEIGKAEAEDRQEGVPPTTPISAPSTPSSEDTRAGIPLISTASTPSEQPAQPISADEATLTRTPSAQADRADPGNITNLQPATAFGEMGKPVEPTGVQGIDIRPKAREPRVPGPVMQFIATIRNVLAPVALAILRALRSALATIGSVLLRLLKNLLPDADVLRLPSSMMVFIAIAIPIILAVVGAMVFLQRGRNQQFQVYYQQAATEAANAATLTDPIQQRHAWQSVLDQLNKAEVFSKTTASQALRTEVTTSLDGLDWVKRLDYQPAIVGGLESGMDITRIVATTTDLFMLNGSDGNVLHAILTARGYELDTSFQCGPTAGPVDVGRLVDIEELPPGSPDNASILGLDANGRLLFCVIGSEPLIASLAPPNTGLGKPVAMTIDQGDLYILDPSVNAVWIYRYMDYGQQPRLFFGDMVPPMQDAIDLAVYNDDLYLLHRDGHISKCTYSGMVESPTRCDDPYPYTDDRPGRTHGPVMEDAIFSQIYFSSFPERSIYMLDPQNQAIYYFSVLLTLQWQYQPKVSLVQGDATGFAISPNRTAFLAIGNQVYYAALP